MSVLVSGRRVALLAVVSVFTAALALVSAGSAATRLGSLPPFPYCGWWFVTTAQSVNVALPDTSAAYWTTPFVAAPGLKIVIKGQYPNARFASVTVYNNAGGVFTRNGVSSGIVDYQIAPDPGSINPFQHVTNRPGRFTIKIQRHVSRAQVNVLPMVPRIPSKGIVPPGTGFIVYRVYLPNGGSFSSVKLPTVVLSFQGRTRSLPVCPWLGTTPHLPRFLSSVARHRVATSLSTTAGRVNASSSTPPLLKFFRPMAATTNSFFPNVANAYVAALFQPTPGTVVVVRGKAATAPPDSSAMPWPNPSYNLRYWSLCNNENAPPDPVVVVPDPQTGGQIYGCSADLNTTVVGGYYTYVLSSLADRPPSATTQNGITWLPYSSQNVQNVLVLRNMLGSAFPNSVQQVPQDGNPASAQAVMGPYYPQMAQCSVSTFATGGVAGCFAASG